ncbi:hypothetical protein GOARA_019_00040 [Gordonia araii NBRC 100433]|uniref:Uncharacterized protein n=1 Tax=Gordonia araii NBRC 100433 TaxID=1073574 RepID=G7GYP7_9ACTN|nr:hypothetical protein [Gordonia araii]NNG98977.1 hypothetical protein [Gordonia araii NBRC 100433]GAB08722.1 hypothetical protein GOARA_019_00040 [Gordonia araii NBRC 100433]
MTDRNERRRRTFLALVTTLAVIFGLVTGQTAIGTSASWADPAPVPAPAPAPAPVPTPKAVPGTGAKPQLCAAPAAETNRLQQKVAELRGRIATHNAAGSGVNTYDKSQVDLYNARARQLNSEKEALNAEISAAKGRMATCNFTAGKLEAYGPPLVALSDATRRRLEAARDRLSKEWNGYSTQSMPRLPNGNVYVPSDSPIRELWDIYDREARTPVYPYPSDMLLQGEPKPSPTDINPATGRPFGATKAKIGPNRGTAAVSPDHIVPKVEVLQMPGFTKLTIDQQWWLMNSPLNLAWLNQTTNRMKGSRDVERMSGIEEEWQRKYKRLQDSIRIQIQEIIDRFIEANGLS